MNYLPILNKIIKINIKNDIGPKMMQKNFMVGILQNFVVSMIFEETKPNNIQRNKASINLYISYINRIKKSLDYKSPGFFMLFLCYFYNYLLVIIF